MALTFTISPRSVAANAALPLAKRNILKGVIEKEILEEEQAINFATDQREGTSYLGTPVYGTLSILEPVHNKFVFNKKTGEYEEKEVTFPYSNKTIGGANYMYIEGCVMEVSQPRNIVKTPIEGQDGTVKEFINNGDYFVKINGFLSTPSPDIYPADDVKGLRQYLDAPVPLQVTNMFLNNFFGITDLVVERYTFKQVEGMRNVQFFTIECVSDFAFVVTEIDTE